MKVYANIESQYYMFNGKEFKTTNDAWKELKQYVLSKYTDSSREEIIIDESQHLIKVITKDTKNLAYKQRNRCLFC